LTWDFNGVGILGGIALNGKAATIAKKAKEANYLEGSFQDVPCSLLGGRKGS
jgi:hypothetical protein